MDHRGERVFHGHRVEHRGQRVPVADVTALHGHVRPRLGQFADQRGHAGRGGAPAADEKESVGAVLVDQVACDETAEGAGGAGDEDRSGGVQERCPVRLPALRRTCSRHGPQPGHEQRARPQCRLRPTGGRNGWQGAYRLVALVDVDHDQPVGVLGLDRPGQAPDGGTGQVRDVAPVGGHGGAGHQYEAAVREPFVRQPRLDDRQETGHRGVCLAGCGSADRPDRYEDGLRCGRLGRFRARADVGALASQRLEQVVLFAAHHGVAAGCGGLGRRTERFPDQAMQWPAPGTQLGCGRRPQGQLTHVGHRRAVRARQAQRPCVGAGRGRPCPDVSGETGEGREPAPAGGLAWFGGGLHRQRADGLEQRVGEPVGGELLSCR
ncbi:hypothetical protein SGRI78S_06493 [Streptomyces griseus subsp. griseus]